MIVYVCVNLFHLLFFKLLRSVVLCLLLILENYWLFFIQIFLLSTYLSLLLWDFNYTFIFDIVPWLLDSLTSVWFHGFVTFFFPIVLLTYLQAHLFLDHVISFDELTKGFFFITVTMFSIFITSRFFHSFLFLLESEFVCTLSTWSLESLLC